MRLIPVKSNFDPAYPQQQVVTDHPELLKHLPRRWQSCRAVVTAAGLTAALGLTFTLSGCVGANIPNPPFLTEDEARSQIQSDMKAYGLDPITDFDATKSSTTLSYVWHDNQANAYYTIKSEDKYLDLFDTNANIGIEYYSYDEKYAYPVRERNTVSNPVKDEPLVLVIDYVQYSDSIHKQVVDFLDWLKAEGII